MSTLAIAKGLHKTALGYVMAPDPPGNSEKAWDTMSDSDRGLFIALASEVEKRYPQVNLVGKHQSRDNDTGGMFTQSRTVYATEWENDY